MSDDEDNDKTLEHWHIALLIFAFLFAIYFFRGYLWYAFGSAKNATDANAKPAWLKSFTKINGPGFRTYWLDQPPRFKWWWNM